MATNQEKNKDRSTENQPMQQPGRSGESEKSAGKREDERTQRTGTQQDIDRDREEENRGTQRGDRGQGGNR